MNRLCTLLLACILSSVVVRAQVSHSKMTYEKSEQEALSLEVPYNADIAEGTIEKYMTEKGYKKKVTKGTWVYKQAVIPSISAEPMDYLFRIERRGKKKAEDATVYLTVLSGADNKLSEHAVARNASDFMDQMLLPQMQQFKYEKDVDDQSAALDKEEKKLKKLEDDGEDMQKKLKRLQDDINENQKKQEEQRKEVERQRGILEEVRNRGINGSQINQ